MLFRSRYIPSCSDLNEVTGVENSTDWSSCCCREGKRLFTAKRIAIQPRATLSAVESIGLLLVSFSYKITLFI